MKSSQKNQRKPILQAMLTIQNAVLESTRYSITLVRVLGAYDTLTALYFVDLSVSQTKTRLNITGQFLPYLSVIQLAGLYRIDAATAILFLVLPLLSLVVLGSALFCFVYETIAERNSKATKRKAGACQGFLNYYFPLFYRVLLINFLQTSIWPFLNSLDSDSTPADRALHTIGMVVGGVNLVLIFIQAAYTTLFLVNDSQWAQPTFSSCAPGKQLLWAIHKLALVLFIGDGTAVPSAPLFSLLNLFLSLVYLALELRHFNFEPPAEALAQTFLDVSLANLALHFFLMDLWDGYSNHILTLINFLVMELVGIYMFMLLKRKWRQVQLPERFNPKGSKEFLSMVRKVVLIAETGSDQEKISVLTDFGTSVGDEREVLFGWTHIKHDDEAAAHSVLSKEFQNRLTAQIYACLEKKLDGIIKDQAVGVELRFLFIRLLFYRRNKQLQSLIQFFDMEKDLARLPAFPIVRGQFNFEKAIERFLIQKYADKGNNKSLPILRAQRYNILFDEFLEQVRLCVDTFERIWSLLQDNSPEVEALITVNKSFYSETQAAERAFRALTEVSTPTYLAYKMYFAFLKEVLFDTKRAATEEENLSYAFRKKYIQMKSADLNVPQLTEDSEKTFLLLAGEYGSFGTVKYASDDLRNFLHLDPQVLVGRPIGEFMPPFMDSYYENWIKDFFHNVDQFEETLSNRQHFAFFLDSRGYFQTGLCNLRLLPSFNDGISFALFITLVAIHPSSPKPPTLIYNATSGEVYCASKETETLHRLNPASSRKGSGLTPGSLNIRQIFPDILLESHATTLARGGELLLPFVWENHFEHLRKGLPRRTHRLTLSAKIRNQNFSESPRPSHGRINRSAFGPFESPVIPTMKIELLRQLTYGDSTIFVISFREHFADEENSEVGGAGKSGVGSSSKEAGKFLPKKVKKRFSDMVAPTTQGQHQRTLLRNIFILKSYFYPYILIKGGMIVALLWLLYYLVDTSGAQMTSIRLASRNVRTVSGTYLTINSVTYFYNLGSQDPSILSSLAFYANLIKTNLQDFKNSSLALVTSIGKTQDNWSDPLYKNWNSTSQNPSVPFEMTLEVPIQSETGLFSLSIHIIDFCRSFMTNAALFMQFRDATLYRFITRNFLDPLSVMIRQVQALPETYLSQNTGNSNLILWMAYVAFAFVFVVFLTTVVLIKRLISTSSSVYLVFAYLSDKDLLQLMNSMVPFRKTFLKKGRLQSIDCTKENGHDGESESGRKSTGKRQGSSWERKDPIGKSFSRDEAEGTEPERDEEVGSVRPGLNSFNLPFKRNRREESRRKLASFAREINRREIRMIVFNLIFFLVPLALFALVGVATYLAEAQATAVFNYFSYLTRIKTSLINGMAIASNQIYGLGCNGCVQAIQEIIQPLLAAVPNLVQSSFALQSFFITSFYSNITAFNVNFCSQAYSVLNLDSFWLSQCNTYPILSKGLETVLVYQIQEMESLVATPSLFGLMYRTRDIFSTLRTIVYSLENLEELLASEYSSVLNREYQVIVVAVAVLFVLSLGCYLLFWLGFMKDLEQAGREKKQIIQIFQAGIIQNPNVEHWIRENTAQRN